jgi:hypothetical protein
MSAKKTYTKPVLLKKQALTAIVAGGSARDN